MLTFVKSSAIISGLNKSSTDLRTSTQRISTGLRINSASDDPAGLSISNKLTAQIRGSEKAINNTKDGVSLIQAAGKYLMQISENLQRVRELGIQASNGTYSTTDRSYIQLEAEQVLNDITTTIRGAHFNGIKLLDGTFNGKILQVGSNAGDQITVSISALPLPSIQITDFGQFAAQYAYRGDTPEIFAAWQSPTDSPITAFPVSPTWDSGNDVLASTSLSIDAQVAGQAPTQTTVTTSLPDGQQVAITVNGYLYPWNAVWASYQGDSSGVYSLLSAGTNQAGLTATPQLSANQIPQSNPAEILSGINLSTSSEAEQSIRSIDEALTGINSSLSNLGAYENRLDAIFGTLQNYSINLSASRSK